jgi:hypothetical protein
VRAISDFLQNCSLVQFSRKLCPALSCKIGVKTVIDVYRQGAFEGRTKKRRLSMRAKSCLAIYAL